MRNTRGKPTEETILLGDRDLAEAMADALAAEERVERYTHGFHTYPAGLHPDAARDLLALFPGERVLDPFCGGGTVLVEAMVAGRQALGRDIGPTALRVARARTAILDDAQLTTMRSTARKLTEKARPGKADVPEPIFRALESWYADHAIRELAVLKAGIEESDPVVKPLLEAIFSSILVKTSWRKSDTSNKREKHKRPPGTTAILFHKKTRELGRKLTAFRDAVPEGTSVHVGFADARQVDPRRPVDLVLTSPPYPSTYDYLPMQHLRNVWFDDAFDANREIGPRRGWRDGGQQAWKAWREDTARWTDAVAKALVPGGKLVIVIGDGLTPTGMVDSSETTELAAKRAGLIPMARASLERPDHARGTSRWEHVFCFEKPVDS